MSVQLPETYVDKMKDLLEDEFPEFLSSYDQPRHYGLRVNTLKIAADRFLRISPFTLRPVPWCPEGFYYEEGERPGKHPYYHAGLYYIQEPSAMLPVELLNIKPCDKVLDLCAAPGGKSTQIAAKLQHAGLLVANDNHPDRAKALVKNMELFGVRNAVVLNEQPERLAAKFPSFFDKILIDAPCSGEGMFRKEEEMAKQWERHSPDKYAAMQRNILKHAAKMLAPGGTIVYSTCTFSPEENEAMVAEFLDRHPQFQVEPVRLADGFVPGRAEWIPAEWRGENAISEKAAEAVQGTVRLWPHRVRGEGHFAAVLRHCGSGNGCTDDAIRSGPANPDDTAFEAERPRPGASGAGGGKRRKAGEEYSLEPFFQFVREHLSDSPFGNVRSFGPFVYSVPDGTPDLAGLHTVRPGWFLGTLKKNRFEPSHALAVGLSESSALRTIDLPSGSPEAVSYLKGETLAVPRERIERRGAAVEPKGYCLVCIDGYPAGWGKWMDGILKNEYPAGWRWT